MGVGMTILIFVLIICGFVTFWMYMGYCASNGINMFSNPRYEERIRKLEKQMEELKKE